MKKQTQLLLAGLVSALVVAGCATGPSVAELNTLTDQIVKASFRDQGIAKVDRVLATDETNRLCSQADVAGKPLDEKTAKRIEEANLKSIKWPSDGKFLGDWKEGEKIAQSGRGLTWTDDAKTVNGGNCYNCHQISKEEISFGTIGPSLYHYGKIRGVTDPNSAAAKPIVEYT
ncbi:MAG: sulfur oxidation c-type cytochrome SoxX, partial [Limnohabitans sp.]